METIIRGWDPTRDARKGKKFHAAMEDVKK
jgi:hypothetical protein